jgi:hypothetical protein|tara:strand:- start:1235 stop:1408 length:174 start_codon:yes stop_codon:yes gene_type:complete
MDDYKFSFDAFEKNSLEIIILAFSENDFKDQEGCFKAKRLDFLTSLRIILFSSLTIL